MAIGFCFRWGGFKVSGANAGRSNAPALPNKAKANASIPIDERHFPGWPFSFSRYIFATFSHGTAVGSRFFPFLKKEHCEEFDVLSESGDGFVIRVEDRPESAAVSVGGLVLADGAPSSVAVRHHPTLAIISRGMKIAVTYLDMFQ